MRPRSDHRIEPRLTIFGAEDNVNDDVAEGLRHAFYDLRDMHGEVYRLKRAFSASFLGECFNPGALPQARIELRRWRCVKRTKVDANHHIPWGVAQARIELRRWRCVKRTEG